MILILEKITDWLYPRRCALCDGILKKGDGLLCPVCRIREPQPIEEPRCKHCGKPLEADWKEYCSDCENYDHWYDGGLGLYLYRDPLKESLIRFKFKGRKEYGSYYGHVMCLYGAGFIKQFRPEVIIPVPIHKRKYRKRGYNQAEVLARFISRGFSIPLRTDLVLRKKITKAQKELSRKERAANLRRAFLVKPETARYKSVLLVDDIYTTGSTVNAIALKLKECGVKKVYFLALCIGKGR